MSAPLTTRDALTRVLAQHSESYDGDCGLHFGCSCGWDNGTVEDNEGFDAHLADALLASGALIDATQLAEDVRLVHAVADRVSGGVLEYHEVDDVVALRETARNHLDALAAALSAQSERAEVER